MTDDQQKLDRWLREYELYRIQREENPVEWPQAGIPVVCTDEPAPGPGQIRLWPAGDLSEEPVYGVVLPAEYGWWWVLPFSPLAFPAVPEECVCRDAPPVRVVEGWNRRKAARSVVAGSWCVDRMEEAEVFRLRGWVSALEAEQPAPEVLRERIGPPLRHPLDPRYGYLEDETRRVDGCLGEPRSEYGVGEELCVAEPGASYGERRYRVGETEAILVVNVVGLEWNGEDVEGAGVEAMGEGGVRIGWRGGFVPLPGAHRVDWRAVRVGDEVYELMLMEG